MIPVSVPSVTFLSADTVSYADLDCGVPVVSYADLGCGIVKPTVPIEQNYA
jgi:hypothetical protein